MQLTQAISDFVTGYFSTHERSQKTRLAYSSDLRQFAKYIGGISRIQELGALQIEDWAAFLRKEGYSPASMRRKLVVLKVFCSYWMRRGILIESPFWRVKLSLGRTEQLPRTLTEREIQELLAHAGRHRDALCLPRKGSVLSTSKSNRSSSCQYRALRNLALVELLFATGIRVGEASSLNVEDFFATDLVFRVQGKGGRDRLAYVVDEQTVLIQRQHLEERLKIISESRALFLNAFGNRLSTQGMANVIAQFRRNAGIERHVTPHMLRHTVATLLLRNGMDIRVVQEFLGHASIATTQRYTHIVKEHLIGELRKHHPSLGFRSLTKAS
jgi:integrase/recombinase XerD